MLSRADSARRKRGEGKKFKSETNLLLGDLNGNVFYPTCCPWMGLGCQNSPSLQLCPPPHPTPLPCPTVLQWGWKDAAPVSLGANLGVGMRCSGAPAFAECFMDCQPSTCLIASGFLRLIAVSN